MTRRTRRGAPPRSSGVLLTFAASDAAYPAGTEQNAAIRSDADQVIGGTFRQTVTLPAVTPTIAS